MLKKFFILLSVALISACSSSNSDESIEQSKIEKSFIGTIYENQDFISGVDASHYILTDAQTKIYVQSFIHDLDSYEDSRVRVTGGFSAVNVSNSTVDFLSVDSIDLLDVSVETEDQNTIFKNYAFDELGISMSLPEDLNIKENQNSLFFSFENTNFTISPIILKSKLENHLQLYSDYQSDLLRVDNDTNFHLFILSDFEHLYVLDRGVFVVEIKVSLFENSLQSSIDEILMNLDLQALPDSIFTSLNTEIEDVELESVESKEESSNSEDNQDQDFTPEANENSDNQPTYSSTLKIDQVNLDVASSNSSNTVSESTTVDSAPVVSSPYDQEISRFELVANTLLGDVKKIQRYFFAESKHFYVEYLSTSDENKRALIAYNGNLKVAARFVEDEVMDWRMISGQNLVYDQQLTMVDSTGVSYSLKEGYRLFESLPLEFSLQYPMQMYYMRNGDTYIFANDPNLSDIAFEISNISDFPMNKYTKINDKTYFNGSDYVLVFGSKKLLIENESVSIDVLNYILSTVSILSSE